MDQIGSSKTSVTVPAGVDVRWNVRIAVRDGVQLSAIEYLPRNQACAAPAILTMTPYVAQTHHAHGLDFAANGYPFVIVDVRGRGNSEGEFDPLNDAEDGSDVVEWLAQQTYCNGKVAMWGASYLGYCQWLVAAQRPAHLATIVPTAAAYFGVDVPLRNNVFVPYTIRWLTMISGRTLQDRLFADRSYWSSKFRQWFEAGLPFRQLDSLVGNPSALFQEWISHPQRDAYWDRYNPGPEHYAQLSLPILTITGAYDGDQLGALEHYRQHMSSASAASRARHYLIIGPWDHHGTSVPKAEFCGLKVGPASVVDLRKLHREWYAWTMQGGPKPEFLKKNVAYYVTGAEQWRYADTLEEITAYTQACYLQSATNPVDVFESGLLAAQPATSEPAQYVYDPRDVAHAELESTVDPESLIDQRMVFANRRGSQLVYHTPPFAEPRQISGFFRLSAWLAIDRPDTDFIAAVYDIGLDGSALLLTTDWVRARYREGLQQAKLIDTREPLRYDFSNFMFVGREIGRGHRLRLVIGPINSMEWQKNYNAGGVVSEESVTDAVPVTVTLFQDKAHASALYVPCGAPGEQD